MAAAGTGKTTIIAERFRRLAASGADPSRILVLTFTERAASQMRERILATGVEDAPNVGTFHSLAQRWLREEGGRVGIAPSFRILAGPDRWILLRELMWELGDEELVASDRPDDLVSPLLRIQERLKQELIPVSRVRAWAEHSEDDEKARFFLAATRLFDAYEAHCRRERLLDFDELLYQAVRLLELPGGFRERFAGRFEWLMVDEYQDTNLAQERLVELLALGHRNVLVVGDDDQSIYRFRGASRASMERFLSVFPGAPTITLGRNRRSTRRIVAAAAALIAHNPDRLEKVLEGTGAAGAPPELWTCATGREEACAIAGQVGALVEAGSQGAEIAVLTRTNAAAKPVVEALSAAGIPYQQRSPHGFYQRPEVRDLLALLRVLRDPGDLVALGRAASAPPAALSLEEVLARVREGRRDGLEPLAALERWDSARGWARLLGELSDEAQRLGVNELLFELISRTGYLEAALAGAATAAEADRIRRGVTRFAELVDEHCERRQDHSLEAYLARLDLVLASEVEEEGTEPEERDPRAVQVMTIHQAKGLEFDAVFLPGVVEGRLPQPRRQDRFALPTQVLEPAVRGREDHVAEERRLCYVAATRARRRLYLSWAERYDGGRTWRRSRFLTELEQGPVKVRELPPAEASPLAPAAGSRRPAQDRAPVVLSFSAVSTYRECPKQFRYRYQLRLPARLTVEGAFGSAMHEALRRLGEARAGGVRLDAAAVQAATEAAWAEVELPDERRRPALQRLGNTELKRYLDAGGLASPPAFVEKSFTTTLDGRTLTGIIDRIDPPPPTQEGGEVGSLPGASEGGAWRIVDYKTGTPLPASRLRRDLQLLLYALGAREALGLSPVELEIVYLRDGRSVVIPAEDALLEEARTIVAEAGEGVEAGRFEAQPERRRCRLCSYRLLCDDAL